ncbi:hypothetical protein A6A05_06490 [Magnetospirillum moscoviense]|uniref:Uncharacterized protein n=1 Tax=Magnetospirillum moscoviense TaxID=1437059 RepID=A0A178MYQ1_9PROT|nr:hypothetical protein A6A05_06490 [Magnetospirillum moscoviense]
MLVDLAILIQGVVVPLLDSADYCPSNMERGIFVHKNNSRIVSRQRAIAAIADDSTITQHINQARQRDDLQRLQLSDPVGVMTCFFKMIWSRVNAF